MRGETLLGGRAGENEKISIHSPHARGDVHHRGHLQAALAISIHSPHARGDDRYRLSLRSVGISIHSPHARGDPARPDNPGEQSISIHSPHARGDGRRAGTWRAEAHFNPLPSCEGRQHKPPKIHPDLCQPTQQNHDTPLFEALQAPFCGAEPDIRSAKPTGKP